MSAVPEGFATVTPCLVLKNAARAIDLYKKAFGAIEESRSDNPETGKIMHACIRIGNSPVFVSDEVPGMMALTSNANFYLYLSDVDAAFEKAKKAGLKERSAPQDMFWGDRTGSLTDEFGVHWTVATHQRDVKPEDLEKGMKDMVTGMQNKTKAA